MLSLKDFIDDNIEDIDDGKWTDVFQDAWEQMSPGKVADLFDMLLEIGINEEELEWASIEGQVLYRIAFELDNNAWNDMANSWSRLNWVIAGLQTSYDKDENDIKQHILKNAKKLNLNIKPLDIEYSWDGSQEYDLGWFKPEYYEEEPQ